jgi:hypothetical protein
MSTASQDFLLGIHLIGRYLIYHFRDTKEESTWSLLLLRYLRPEIQGPGRRLVQLKLGNLLACILFM